MKKTKISRSDHHLCELLEWARGNRGTKHCNPYAVPEVKAALVYLAEKQGILDYLNVKTERGSYEVE